MELIDLNHGTYKIEKRMDILKYFEIISYYYRPLEVCFLLVKVMNTRISTVAGGSISSTFLKACFSCGEDPSQVQEGRSWSLSFSFYFSCHRCMTQTLVFNQHGSSARMVLLCLFKKIIIKKKKKLWMLHNSVKSMLHGILDNCFGKS